MLLDLLKLFLPLLFFIGLNLFVQSMIKKSFGFSLPVTLIISAFIMYLSQLCFSTFIVGFYLLLLCAIAGFPLVYLRFGRKWKILRDMILPGLIACLIMYFFACVILLRKDFFDWDEYTHWGMMVKESLRLDRFYCIPESRLMWHKDYPPLTCVYEVLFCKLCGYSEGNVTIAMQFLCLSFVIPWGTELFYNRSSRGTLKKRRILYAILTAACLELMILMFELFFDSWNEGIINSILPDMLLAFIFGATFFYIVREKNVNWLFIFCTSLMCGALALIKQSGMAFSVLILLSVFVKVLTEKLSLKKALCLIGIVAAVFVFCYVSWSICKGRYLVQDDFSRQSGQFNLAQIDIKQYYRILLGKGEGLQTETMRHFCMALLRTPINNGWLPITYVSLPGIVILIVFLLHRFSPRLFQNKADILNYGITFLCGTIGYAFMMSVMYMFCFPDNEMEILTGYTRYMSSWAFSEALVCFFLLILVLAENRSGLKKLIIATLCIACLLNPLNLCKIIPQALTKNPYESYRQYALRLKKDVPDNSIVFIIYDNQQTMHPQWYSPLQLFTQYYNNKVDIVEKYMDAFVADYSDKTTKNNILESIRDSDYLYVVHTSDNVNDGLAELTGGKDLKDNSIYIVNERGMLELLSDGSEG